MFRIKRMVYPTERSTLELFYRKLIEYHYCVFRDYPSDCVNRKLRDFSRSFFIYVLTL